MSLPHIASFWRTTLEHIQQVFILAFMAPAVKTTSWMLTYNYRNWLSKAFLSNLNDSETHLGDHLLNFIGRRNNLCENKIEQLLFSFYR